MTTTTLGCMYNSHRWLLHDNKKIPYYANGLRRNGSLDEPGDAAQLTTFSDAVSKLRQYGEGWGLGFALGPDGGSGYWQGIDLDDIDDNKLEYLEKILPGYVEYSPSHRGIHAIGYGDKFDNLGPRGIGIEAYSYKRYFTFTGAMIRDDRLTDLNYFIKKHFLQPYELRDRDPKQSKTKESIKSEIVEVNNNTYSYISTALSFINADDYQEWISVGHALKELGQVGNGLFHQWSAKSSKYEPGDAEKRWKSFQPKRTGYRAIFAKAQRAGWINPYAKTHESAAAVAADQPPFQEKPARFNLMTGSELECQPPIIWRIKNVFPARGLAAIYGASGAGKSFLAFDQAMAIAEGAAWFGHRVKQGPVCFVALEGESGLPSRAAAWKFHAGRDLPEARWLRLLLDPIRLDDAAGITELSTLLPRGTTVYIDTLNRAAPHADENSSKDMGAIIEGAKLLQKSIDGLVILIAHTGKDASRGLRGHSSLFAALDAAIVVTRQDYIRSWKVDKSKDGQDGVECVFELLTIDLGTDEDGDPMTSCAVESHATSDRIKQSRALTPNQRNALESFKEAAVARGQLNSDGTFMGLHVDDWRDYFYRASTSDNITAKQKSFQRLRNKLIEIGRMIVNDDIYMLAGADSMPDVAKINQKLRDKDKGQDQDTARTCPARKELDSQTRQDTPF